MMTLGERMTEAEVCMRLRQRLLVYRPPMAKTLECWSEGQHTGSSQLDLHHRNVCIFLPLHVTY